MNNVARAIEEARSQLLDLGRRNRLIHCSLKPSRSLIPIVNERSDEVFRILWREQRRMSFSASGQMNEAQESAEAQEVLPLENGDEARFTDYRLETELPANQLEALLLNAYRAARTVEEEQGVSVLYLALGFLRWREATVEWDAVSPNATRVQWTLRYSRDLDPAWYFGPWERYAVRLAAGYLIDSVATP